MTDLVTFLQARLDEDEQVAQQVTPLPGPGPTMWVLDDDYKHNTLVIDASRVLADVTAKRAIVALHTGHHECVTWRRHSTVLEPDDEFGEPRTSTTLVSPGYIHENDPTLRLLASVYSDHADYRQEWKPDV